MTPKPHFDLFAASCAPDGGIYRYALTDDGKLSPLGKILMDRPMYFQKLGDQLHAILRAPEGFGGSSAYLSCNAYDEAVDMRNAVSTDGIVACHLSVCGDDVYAVNYLSGNLVRVGKKTVTHEATADCKPGRQDAPHTHCVIPSPDGRYLLCTDLGLDQIRIYDRALNFVSQCDAPRGCGVRHIVFSHDGAYLYAANELDSSLSVYAYREGMLTLLSTVSCEVSCSHNLAAAIRLSPDGTRLYVSQRGEDVISIFEVQNRERLRLLANHACGGNGPRDICLSPDGSFMAVANEGSGTLVAFRLDGDEMTVTDELSLVGALCVYIEEIKEG
jgi:6-phosphogluconolactonase